MIKSRYINAIILAAVVLAGIFALFFTYFPDATGIAAADSSMAYENILFDKDSIMTIDIEIDEDDWAEMLENAVAEEFYECDVTINGTTVSHVGIRPKGNTSLTQIASDDTTDRFSFKFKFDEYVDEQTCYGLDSMAINNVMSDATYMKEYLAYDMMDYIGVTTPLYSYAKVTVNGEDWGLYLAVEIMEESFAQRNYGADYGELYKPDTMDNGGGGAKNMTAPETPADAFDTAENSQDNTEGQMTAGLGVGESNNTINGAADDISQSSTGDTSVNENMPNEDTGETGSGTTDGASNNDTASAEETQGNAGRSGPPSGGIPLGAREMPEGMSRPDRKSSGDGSTTNADDMAQTPPSGAAGGSGMMGSSGGGTDLVYTDDEIQSYSAIFDSSIFDSTEADHQRVITALKNLNDGTDLDKYIDVEATLRYFAANAVLVNFDSYTGNLKHNYYLYEKDGQLTILPWDFNLAFAGFQTNDSSAAVNSPIDTPVSGTSLEERPLLGKLLEVEEYQDLYHDYLQEIITGYFDSGYFEETIEKLDALIGDAVKNDPTAFYTYEEYTQAVETLKEFGRLRALSITGQLEGSIPSTSEGQEADPNSLIDASDIQISDMGTQGGGNRTGGQMPGNEEGNKTGESAQE